MPPPNNDECAPTDRSAGAKLLVGNTSEEADIVSATENPHDPGFCCHTGFDPKGSGGDRDNLPCASDAECPGGTCPPRVPLPSTGGLATVCYKFVAQQTSAQISTCNSNAPVNDTLLQVFEPDDPTDDVTACSSLRLLNCVDDTHQCGANGKHARLCLRNLTPGKLYYILAAAKTSADTKGLLRVSIVHANCTMVPPVDCQHNGRLDVWDIWGGYSSDSNGNGVPDECDESKERPKGILVWQNPPDGAVDARRPHKPYDADIRLWIQSILVRGPSGAPDHCWTLCETDIDGAPNTITDVFEQNGECRLALARPITQGAATTITYDHDTSRTATFISHPGNVNADSSAAPADILDLIDVINGVFVLPYGVFSGDLDRSGVIDPADILEEIDLLNGAGAYDVWNGSTKASATGICPTP